MRRSPVSRRTSFDCRAEKCSAWTSTSPSRGLARQSGCLCPPEQQPSAVQKPQGNELNDVVQVVVVEVRMQCQPDLLYGRGSDRDSDACQNPWSTGRTL